MQLTSFHFLLFAALVLTAYYCIPKKGRWALLLAASCVFYLAAGTEFLFFILLTTVTTYAAARLIGKRLDRQNEYLAAHKADMSREERKEYKANVKKGCRVFMLICLIVNFGVLFFCKGALIEPLRSALAQGRLSFLTLGLPMGISFYMFQSTGYVIDVYRGNAKAEKNFFRFALFVSFFPQLIQGPISKFSQLAPTLYAPHDFDAREVSYGLQRMLWGYFKKLVIADRIAAAVVTLKGAEFTGTGFWLLAVFYAIQIYGDFTGGIDIVIGYAQALGIKLPENFIRPFFASNISEFWRRWHISLGEWMKDYIFYPISVSQPMLRLSKYGRAKFGEIGKRLPVYVASIATWFATGIWHGLTPNFVVWGMLNCLCIVLYEEILPYYSAFCEKTGLKHRKLWHGVEIFAMFMLMNLIRACDLFPNVGEYFRRLGSLFTTFNLSLLWDGTMMKLGLTGLDYGILLAGIVLMFCVSLYQEKHGSVRDALAAKASPVRYAVIFALFLVVILMGSYGIGYNASNFIYNQF